ncbi:MAG: hypothetical protein AAFV53_06875 [Myxococcota bacterium]
MILFIGSGRVGAHLRTLLTAKGAPFRVGTLSANLDGVERLIVCDQISTADLPRLDDLYARARRANIQRVILLSCLGAARGYAAPRFAARRGAEELLIHSGLEHLILRAPVHEGFFEKIAQRLGENRTTLLPRRTDNRIAPIASPDIAASLWAALSPGAHHHRVLSIGGPDVMSARDALEIACRAHGVSTRFAIPLPRRLSRVSARHQERSLWFSEDFTPPTVEDFGLKRTPLQDALNRTS